MLSIAIIILASAAIYLYTRHAEAKRAKLRESLSYIDDISPRLQISVVVSGHKGVGYIASLLRSESTSYQVIVVADFAEQLTLLREITQYFGLFATTPSHNGEIQQGAIRTLYRSHKRLFTKLVVVDSPRSKLYTPYEVGASVSDYIYNLQIRSHRTLRPEAISNLLLEMATRPEGEIEKITSRRGERFKLIFRETALANSSHKIKCNKYRCIRIGYRILE